MSSPAEAWTAIEAELVEALQSLEPDAPGNGRVIDTWHASACVLRAYAMLLGLKETLAPADQEPVTP